MFLDFLSPQLPIELFPVPHPIIGRPDGRPDNNDKPPHVGGDRTSTNPQEHAESARDDYMSGIAPWLAIPAVAGVAYLYFSR